MAILSLFSSVQFNNQFQLIQLIQFNYLTVSVLKRFSVIKLTLFHLKAALLQFYCSVLIQFCNSAKSLCIILLLSFSLINTKMNCWVSCMHISIFLRIPGRLNDRRTPLGELNWIFTAITDTIAWNVLPRGLSCDICNLCRFSFVSINCKDHSGPPKKCDNFFFFRSFNIS